MVHFIWIIRAHLNDIVAMDKRTFLDPWSEEKFVKMIRRKNIIGLCIEDDERFVGYVFYELFEDKIEIIRIACKGYGVKAINHLKKKLHDGHRERIIVHVPEVNLEAQLFFKSQGFLWVETKGDNYIMEKGIKNNLCQPR